MIIVIGIIIGFVAGLIWKDNRPIGVKGDYLVAILSYNCFRINSLVPAPCPGFQSNHKIIRNVWRRTIHYFRDIMANPLF